jgi:hypothetical protein
MARDPCLRCGPPSLDYWTRPLGNSGEDPRSRRSFQQGRIDAKGYNSNHQPYGAEKAAYTKRSGGFSGSARRYILTAFSS